MKNYPIVQLVRIILFIGLVTGSFCSAYRDILEASTSPSLIESNRPKPVPLKAALTSGTYNDTSTVWNYRGNWALVKSSSAFMGQIHESGTINDNATITMEGSAFTLMYSSGSTRGAINVLIDGRRIATINQHSPTTVYRRKWTSPHLSPGNHLVKFVHASGNTIDIDMIAVSGGKIIITADNQVVQNVRITSTDGDAIHCVGYSNIKISNVVILYDGGNGIFLHGCNGAVISNVNILFTGASASGPNNNTERNCIETYNSNNLMVNNVLATDCSSGVYTVHSDAPNISFIKCVNMRGPYPRGQCVQFNQSNNCSLSDFYSYNDLNVAWTSDNISVFSSSNCAVQRGIIDGNNRANGGGISVEHNSSNVTVTDVDVYHWCNSAYGTSNGKNVVFTRVHASNSYKPCTQGGPTSGTGVAFISYNFTASPLTVGTIFYQAQYYNLAPGNQILYDGNPSTVVVKDIRRYNFTRRIPIIPIVPPIGATH